MTRYLTWAALATLMLASPLVAQSAKHGDLLPRNDIIFYATSDKPDAAYRLFGKNDKGEWRLRAWPYQMIEKDAAKEGADPEKTKQQRAMADYLFSSLDSTGVVEVGFLDVTLGGGKFVLVLRAKAGASYNEKPEFLRELFKEEIKIRETNVQVYEIPKDKPEEPKDGKEAPRPAFTVPGFDRFYVAKIEGGLVITNFESSMQDVIERYTTKDYSESLSSREEFAKWRETRTPHDLSFFIVGKEIQKAVERMMPDDKQTGGRDIEGAYNDADRWLQLREYQSIVVDFDYDDTRKGFGIDAKVTTRRKTRLLEQLAIAPAEFKLLKYLPADSMMSIGLQIGDPAKTWEKWLEFARDGEQIANRAMKKGTPAKSPDDKPDTRDKSVGPLDMLKALQEAGTDDDKPSEVERTVRGIDEQLAKFGTSIQEILGALGTEVIGHVTGNTARVLNSGGGDFDDMFGSAHIGIIVGIKDAKTAQTVLLKVRSGGDASKDTFTTSTYAGQEFNVNVNQGWAYALTADAVLISFTRPGAADNATHLESGLKRMIDASKSTANPDVKFMSPSSKFVRVDIGRIVKAFNEMKVAQSQRLDRYSMPVTENGFEKSFEESTFALRSVEDVMSVEVGMRIYGLPDFIGMFDGLMSRSSASPRDAIRYSQDNLREIGRALGSHALSTREAITLEGLLKLKGLRAGHFQTPFDVRWQGGYRDLGWTTLRQIEPGPDGSIPDWVDKKAVDLILANEKEAFVSYSLAPGDLRGWINESKVGFIVVYQTEATTCGGHLVLYANGESGWLHASVFKEALALNAKGEMVPGEDRWSKGPKDAGDGPKRPAKGDPNDPWLPDGK